MSGPTLYSYVWNNPTNLTDPTGFEAQTSAQKAVTDAVAQAIKDGITDLRIDENGNIVGTAPSSASGASSAAHGPNFKADATNTTPLLAEAEHTSDHKAVLEAQKKRAENDAGKADGAANGQNEKPPLQLLHSDSTIKSPSSNYESLKKEPTESIVKSLKPGQPEPLKVTEEGKVMDGNTRVKILQERGVDVNSLPRTTYKKSGLGAGVLSTFGVGMVVELLDAIQKLPPKDAPPSQPTPQASPQGNQQH